jgi:hypothetical protein
MSKLERNFFKVKKLRGKKKVILKAFGIQIALQKTLKKQRYCKTCGVDVGKGKSYCSPCMDERQNPTIKRFCKMCDVEVGKGKSYCSPCVGKKIKKRESVNKRKRNETTLCGFEGCKESRGYGIHSCEYHSYKNRKKRHLEEIIQCNDCGVDLGKRKDFPYLGLRGKCESCKYKKMRNYQNKYYKERWHTDPEYKAKRKKWTTDWVEKTGWVR